jgi:hypothetical protein
LAVKIKLFINKLKINEVIFMNKKNQMYMKKQFVFDELGRLVIEDQSLLAKINGAANLSGSQPNILDVACNACGNLGCGVNGACDVNIGCNSDCHGKANYGCVNAICAKHSQ